MTQRETVLLYLDSADKHRQEYTAVEVGVDSGQQQAGEQGKKTGQHGNISHQLVSVITLIKHINHENVNHP